MGCMKKLSLTFCVCLLSLASILSAKDAAPADVLPATVKPWDQHYVDFEVGYLWKVGGSTELNYGMVPVMLTWRSPEVLGLDFANGSKIIVRNRLSLLGQWVETGPENH